MSENRARQGTSVPAISPEGDTQLNFGGRRWRGGSEGRREARASRQGDVRQLITPRVAIRVVAGSHFISPPKVFTGVRESSLAASFQLAAKRAAASRSESAY